MGGELNGPEEGVARADVVRYDVTMVSSPPARRFGPSSLLAFGAIIVFLWLAHAVRSGATQTPDMDAVQDLARHQTPALRALMQGLSLAGSGWVSIPLALLSAFALIARPGLKSDALRLLIALAGGQCLVTGLKLLYHRPRPSPAFAHLGYSFPSGHSFFAVTMYGLLAERLTRVDPARRPWVRAGAGLLILGIGFSRVALGVHYPTDVLAGFSAGYVWLRLCLALPPKPSAG